MIEYEVMITIIYVRENFFYFKNIFSTHSTLVRNLCLMLQYTLAYIQKCMTQKKEFFSIFCEKTTKKCIGLSPSRKWYFTHDCIRVQLCRTDCKGVLTIQCTVICLIFFLFFIIFSRTSITLKSLCSKPFSR